MTFKTQAHQRFPFAACFMLAAPAGSSALAQACDAPHYRWQAKVATDLVNREPRPATITSILTRWTIPPVGPGRSYWCAPRTASEREVYVVEGWLRFVDTTKDDGDWHMELTDAPDDPIARCIVAEIPAPRWASVFAGPRATIDTVLRSIRWKRSGRLDPPVPIRLSGAPFFDAEHVHGRSRPRAQGHGHCNGLLLSLWEIHPVYRIERLEPSTQKGKPLRK